jgi:hypothetical protein
MKWNIDFISHDDFKKHVAKTIERYGDKLESYDIKKFNSNLIDPVKMIFDKAVYGEDWKTLISNEIFRQRDKTNNNEIGYFHQRLFDYLDGCHVPPNGKEGGWDVIYDAPDGYEASEGDVVHKIYVEMKNKHNTMNSSAASKTYIKMQNQLLQDDDCACFLVEAIAKRSQNIVWKTTVDKRKVSHKRIRRVSIDKFYGIVTGEPDAFYQICMVLPSVVDEVFTESSGIVNQPNDTVYDELVKKAEKLDVKSSDMAMLLAMYMLGFSTYDGFKEKE